MIEKAIEKINAEMQKDPSNRYMEIIGHYIIDRCDETLAAKIAEGKTLKGAMTAVEQRARNVKTGNVAVLTPGEVFGEVDKYFGLTTDTAAQWKAVGLPRPQPDPPAGRGGGDIDLADFF